MIYGSVSTGSHCEKIAFEDELGWECAFVSDIDRYANQVIRYHAPDTPNLGDFSKIEANDQTTRIDLLCGGTPCQDFSIAGLRAGLAGERGNLTLEFVKLADRLKPTWILWENVPGVLSQDGGRAFGAFLGGLAQLGYGFAYRVLDAQFFGVPQRRRRVFVVGHLGDWRRAAAVLFERESLSGHPAPSREAGARVAQALTRGFANGGADDNKAKGGFLVPDEVAPTFPAGFSHGLGHTQDQFIVGQCHGSLRSMNNRDSNVNGGGQVAVAFGKGQHTTGHQGDRVYGEGDAWGSLSAGGGNNGGGGGGLLIQSMQVRRLIPIECERLQGWPDDWTRYGRTEDGECVEISDTQRYKIIGNGWALPVVRWIAGRIDMIEKLSQS